MGVKFGVEESPNGQQRLIPSCQISPPSAEVGPWASFVPSFSVGSGPAYSGPQR